MGTIEGRIMELEASQAQFREDCAQVYREFAELKSWVASMTIKFEDNNERAEKLIAKVNEFVGRFARA